MSRGQREAGAESRDRLLAAGSSLIHELPTSSFLRSLTARGVAARAGYSQGAFYHHWETQEDYVSDLVDWMLDPSRADRAQAVAKAQVAAAAVGTTEAVGGVAVASVREAMRSEAFAAEVILWAQHSTNELIAEKIRALQRRISADTLDAVRFLFAEHGWSPAPGLTAEGVAEAMVAIVRGFALSCAVDEDVDPAIAGAAVVNLLTPPPGGPPVA